MSLKFVSDRFGVILHGDGWDVDTWRLSQSSTRDLSSLPTVEGRSIFLQRVRIEVVRDHTISLVFCEVPRRNPFSEKRVDLF